MNQFKMSTEQLRNIWNDTRLQIPPEKSYLSINTPFQNFITQQALIRYGTLPVQIFYTKKLAKFNPNAQSKFREQLPDQQINILQHFDLSGLLPNDIQAAKQQFEQLLENIEIISSGEEKILLQRHSLLSFQERQIGVKKIKKILRDIARQLLIYQVYLNHIRNEHTKNETKDEFEQTYKEELYQLTKIFQYENAHIQYLFPNKISQLLEQFLAKTTFPIIKVMKKNWNTLINQARCRLRSQAKGKFIELLGDQFEIHSTILQQQGYNNFIKQEQDIEILRFEQAIKEEKYEGKREQAEEIIEKYENIEQKIIASQKLQQQSIYDQIVNEEQVSDWAHRIKEQQL